MRAQAIVFSGPNEVRLQSFELRDPGPDEVVIESHYTCISPGTELRRLRGKEHVGGAPFPLVPGYCLAGRVMTCGADAKIEPGTRVVTFLSLDAGGLGLAEGGHVSHAVTPCRTLAQVPDEVDLLDASASVLAGIAYHGLRMSRPRTGERVAVVGLGVVGQLAARLHAAAGADVVGCDLLDHRLAVCEAAGIRAVAPGVNMADAFAPFFPDGADLIADCTGIPAVLPEAMAIGHRSAWDPLRDMPSVRYLILGTYEDDFTIPYAAAYAGQYTFMVSSGSQVSDCRVALDMMARREIAVRDLISDVRRPEAAPATYADVPDPQKGLITVAFEWR